MARIAPTGPHRRSPISKETITSTAGKLISLVESIGITILASAAWMTTNATAMITAICHDWVSANSVITEPDKTGPIKGTISAIAAKIPNNIGYLIPKMMQIRATKMPTTSILKKRAANQPEILRWVAAGEEVQVTQQDKVVARVVPAKPSLQPDFLGRAKAIWGEQPPGKPLSEVVAEARGGEL